MLAPVFDTIKRFMPKSLFGRALLILVVPTILAQGFTAYIFYQRHWDTVTRHMSSALAGEIALLVHEIARLPDSRRDEALHLAARLVDVDAEFQADTPELPRIKSAAKDFPEFKYQLKQRLAMPFVLEFDELAERVNVYVKMKGGVLKVSASVKRIASATTYIFILWMMGLTILLLFVATLFLRNQIRPIGRLAEAAESFGRGQEKLEFRPSGALEVRRAARAFLLMRERIERQMQTRIEMLAGISHDLRTPLTRMKLQLALLKNHEAVPSLTADVAQMEHMVQEYLDFARGEGREPTRTVRLSAFLKDVSEHYRRQGQDVPLTVTSDMDVSLRVHAFMRVLHNVIDNAIRYGYHASVRAGRYAGYAEIIVDDEGPGIPEAQRELAFKAFTRLDPSRNSATGGAGLGLTIARDIVLGHGGEILLTDVPGRRGLRVIIRVPM